MVRGSCKARCGASNDGMNVVQERDGNNAVTATYTRGQEIGGGIGGLLARSTADGHFYYHYDGRGNVTQLTDANQTTVARYTYDAFGNTRAQGSQAGQPYRFSTKEQHTYSGLYDYGFRFYMPGLGRWLNRDPIEEAGGLNLYGFVGNDPINEGDLLGLTSFGAQVGINVELGWNRPWPFFNSGLTVPPLNVGLTCSMGGGLFFGSGWRPGFGGFYSGGVVGNIPGWGYMSSTGTGGPGPQGGAGGFYADVSAGPWWSNAWKGDDLDGVAQTTGWDIAPGGGISWAGSVSPSGTYCSNLGVAAGGLGGFYSYPTDTNGGSINWPNNWWWFGQ